LYWLVGHLEVVDVLEVSGAGGSATHRMSQLLGGTRPVEGAGLGLDPWEWEHANLVEAQRRDKTGEVTIA
jgi:hypothetical protein